MITNQRGQKQQKIIRDGRTLHSTEDEAPLFFRNGVFNEHSVTLWFKPHARIAGRLQKVQVGKSHAGHHAVPPAS